MPVEKFPRTVPKVPEELQNVSMIHNEDDDADELELLPTSPENTECDMETMD